MKEADTSLRIALLNVSHLPAIVDANFRRILEDIDGVEVVTYDGRGRSFPDDDEVDAVVITGSIDSVNDGIPYVIAARRWIRSVDVPIFGVCFGHQLLATAYGGDVGPMREDELGYCEITIDRPDDPVFNGLPEQLVSFVCHHDTVVTPPPLAIVLARNEHGIQALRLGSSVSVQFHPEATRAYAEQLIDELEFSEDMRSEANMTITDANVTAARELRTLLTNFVAELRSESSTHDG